MKKKLTAYLMTLLMLMLTLFSGCGGGTEMQGTDEGQSEVYTIDEDGWYYSTEDVALYLHTYGELPDNFITKKEAQSMGWDNKKGNLWEVADGMCIGGDRFYNNEGLLPQNTYYECDIDTLYSSKRGAKRLVFTYSGIVYYTSDHYRSFQRLY